MTPVEPIMYSATAHHPEPDQSLPSAPRSLLGSSAAAGASSRRNEMFKLPQGKRKAPPLGTTSQRSPTCPPG